MEAELLQYVAAGGDAAMVVVAYFLVKMHTRLTRVETTLGHIEKQVEGM